jgi:aryl-alcohol dehydrogenase-like predicted oxidoreductase
VTTLSLGCMNFGKRTPADEAIRIVHRAVDAGITVLDTANVYNDGESERIVGRALKELRRPVEVHTKVGSARAAGGPEGLAPRVIHAAIDASLTRLGVERVDVYYLHAPDRKTPIEDSIGAMAELVRAGKIGAIGVSNYAAWEVLEILQLCDRLGVPRPALSQVIYNLLIRQIELEYLRFTAKFGVRTTVFNPVAGGLLARDHDPRRGIPAGSRFAVNKMYVSRYWTDAMHDAAAALRAAAAAHGATLLELAYGWLRGRPGIDSVLLGPASVAHLEAALAAWEKPLPPELVARADEIHAELVGTDARYAR